MTGACGGSHHLLTHIISHGEKTEEEVGPTIFFMLLVT